jgi:hypothetical protein
MGRGPASKILDLGLEDMVLASRSEGEGLDRTVVRCNQDLARRGVEQTVSKSTVKRYLASLDKATVPVAHQPQVAQQNAAVAIAFADRLNVLDAKLGRWLDEAERAYTPMHGVLYDQSSGEVMDASQARQLLRDESISGPLVKVLIVDWQARLGAAREMRGLLGTYTDLMQRVHDAEEVKAFQESVLDAIREASPDVAAAVLAKLRERQSIVKASLLGA